MSKQKKDDKYLEGILERIRHKIYRICNIYAIPPIEPQDLFQEVVYQIWKSLDKFESKSSINTCVYKITINVCLRSKMKFNKRNSKTDRFESIHFTAVEKEIDTYEQEKFNYLKECISALNETDTSLVVLYLDDLSNKEIAVITGLTENHIAVKMKRIRKKLFECITSKIN
jgi:RNA polymerase sigma-70 factor (ECF subfamily)